MARGKLPQSLSHRTTLSGLGLGNALLDDQQSECILHFFSKLPEGLGGLRMADDQCSKFLKRELFRFDECA